MIFFDIKLFKKYTGKLCSVLARTLSEYGKIWCKKTPVFTVVLCSDLLPTLKFSIQTICLSFLSTSPFFFFRYY